MLAAEFRMRSGSEFAATTRRGRRTAKPSLVLHSDLTSHPGVKVGFVVSKTVGNAVARNRVKRQLRHAVRDLMAVRLTTDGSAGLRVVVRALPSAAAPSSDLVADLGAAWRAAEREGWVRRGSAAGRTADR